MSLTLDQSQLSSWLKLRVSVPLPEDLGWGGRGPLDSDPNAPWPPDSGLALLALLLESVLVSGEADLLGLEMAERPHEGSN